MKKFIKILMASILAVLSIFTMTACNDDDGEQGGATKLYVYTNAGFPPYEYVDSNGKVVGVDVEIMKEIGNVLGYEVVINDIEFNQILDEVTKNPLAVGAAGMTKKAERDAICTASISYTTSVQYVIAPKDSLDTYVVDGKVPVSALQNLSKKSIGVQAGTTGNFLIADAISGWEEEGVHVEGDLEGKGVALQEYTNAIVASNDIGSAIGAVVIDKLPAESITSANANALECYQLDAEPESYVLYFNNNATELIAKVNKVLQVMIDNGVINYYTLKHSGNLA